MNKFFSSVIFLLAASFVVVSGIQAQTAVPAPPASYVIFQVAADTPTPIVTPTPVGGVPVQCGALGMRCCKADEDIKIDVDVDGEGLCFNFLVKLCVSDIFKSAKQSITKMIGLDQLDAVQTCNTSGTPQFKEDAPGSGTYSCLCTDIPKSVAVTTQMCNRYIAPDVARKLGYSTTDGLPKILLDSQAVPFADPLDPTRHYFIDYEKLKNDPEYNSCFNCFNKGGYYSGMGCIYTSNWKDLIEKNIFGWGLGLAGLIAIGCITFAAIQFQLSQGDAEKIKKSRELITSCIMGLMLIIFSIFILRVIGVDILALPGFG